MKNNPTPEITIRAFNGSDSDYVDWVDIKNATAPEYARTVEEVKNWDANHDPKCKQERWLVEQEGVAVARGNFSQNPWEYHPHKFSVDIAVHPEVQNQGIGSRVFDHLIEALNPHEPISVRCQLREDWDSSLNFAVKRGFTEVFRTWESRLDVEPFDATPFAHRYNEPLNHGITIKTASQLREEWPDLMERWFEMDREATKDVPSFEPITFLPYEQWLKWWDSNPNLIWDAIFLAVDEAKHEVAGVSSLWKRANDTDLETGFTGVHPEHRRKGIAFALKLRAIEYAKSVNCPTIRTDNASTNRPMLSINEALGFEKQPAWVEMIKRLREE